MASLVVENRIVNFDAIGHGAPVIFIHSWIGSRRYWIPTMAAIADHCRAYSFDLWGFGDTDRAPQNYDVDSYLTQLEQFMERLGITNKGLDGIVGHGLGAVIALMYASRCAQPDDAFRVVAVSAPKDIGAVNRKRFEYRRLLADRMIDALRGEKVANAIPDVSNTDSRAIVHSLKSLTHLNLRDLLAKTRVPVMLVYGENDPFITPPSDDELTACTQSMSVVKVPNSNHFPMLDEPGTFQRLLTEFLFEPRSGAATTEQADKSRRIWGDTQEAIRTLTPEEGLQKLDALQFLLLSLAASGYGNDDEYKSLRAELLSDTIVGPWLPGLIMKCGDLSQFWSFINKRFINYHERRDYIRSEFAPVLTRLEEMRPRIPSKKLGEAIRILFLAANPTDTPSLRLDVEMRAIDQALHQSEYHDRFDIRQHWAVRIVDLQGYLLRHKPNIVHFSGHGSQSSEIILEDDYGKSHPISARALSRLFGVLKDNIRCVVLNACYSEQQAKAIAEHIDCVVGMSKAVGDAAAITFAASFYQALGFGRDVRTAFELGCVQIDLENLNEQDNPKLIATKGRPEDVVFVNHT